jgi:alpha-aminoadipate carrier protein LysW
MTNCPECDAKLTIPENAVAGEIVDCPECGQELEVTNAETGEVRAAETEGEDWGE